MKKKEIKQIAEKIAEQELIIQNTTDYYERDNAKREIMRITRSIHNEMDLMIIDEYVQDILSKKN